MRVSYEKALEGFARLDASRQLATLSPAYLEIDAERSDDLDSFFWLYEEGERFLYQGGLLASIPGTRYHDLSTPYQYGGPVSNTPDNAFLLRGWQAYTDWCRENEVVLEFVRFHPMLHNCELYPGESRFNRATVWVDLTVQDLMAGYQTRARTAVRKAQKNGLRVEWRAGPESVDWFTEFYHAAMRELAAETFYFFPRSYLRRLLNWKQLRLAVCLNGTETVATAIFLFGPEVAEYHLSASNGAGKRLGSTNLLLHEAAQAAQAEGCRTLYLGGGTSAEPDDKLLFFKAGFSDQRAEFRIGQRVHSQLGLHSLREQFSEAYASRPNRILFYR